MSLEIVASRPVWSKSQMELLRECQRKLFFNSIDSKNQQLSQELISSVSSLKKLRNRYLWADEILHSSIGQQLKLLRQGTPALPLSDIQNQARERMRQEFKNSRTSQQNRRLFEHEYNVSLPSEAWKERWDVVERGLDWFLSSSWFRRLSELGPECWKAVDELLEFDVNGIKTFVKIDVAVETQGKFFLMDWKSSRADERVVPGLQLMALYAHEVWGAEPEQIQAVAVSLMDGKTFHAQIDEESLMETHLRIEEEAELLQKTKAEIGLDFKTLPFPNNLQTCDRCVYQRICHPGKMNGRI